MRDLLTQAEKARLTRLSMALPFLGTIDALGLAAIIAVFLHIVGIHELTPFHTLHAWVARALHWSLSERSLGLVLLVAIALVRFAGGMGTQYLIYRFCYAVQGRMSASFLADFLATDLDYIARKDKAFGVQIVFNECSRYAVGVLQNGLQIAYEALTLLVFAVILVYASPVASLLFIVATGIVFFVVRYLSGNITQALGRRRLRLDGMRFSLITEAFQGFEEIATYSLAPGMVQRYERATSESLQATLLQQVLNLLPKNLFELLVVVGLFGIAVWVSGPMPHGLIATMAILIGAAFRCMPSINRILSARQLIAFEIPVVKELSALKGESQAARRPPRDLLGTAAGSCERRTVRVPAVSVHRKGSHGEFRLEVPALDLGPMDLVLIMGESGCGKSTYLACVAGLLGQGKCRSGVPVRVSYAPQAPFVLNDTLEANIALTGLLPGKALDPGRLNEAARVAQLLQAASDEPIIPLKAVLDGSGAGLSGGQRQRVSLARALYFESDLLILDEVTSGLDEATERMFMEAYRASALRRPTLLVTHRSHLAAAATRVYRFQNGVLT
jgi:ABC-type bacteriocin/lantibiotic exporter with double-glycine peptidase domain